MNALAGFLRDSVVPWKMLTLLCLINLIFVLSLLLPLTQTMAAFPFVYSIIGLIYPVVMSSLCFWHAPTLTWGKTHHLLQERNGHQFVPYLLGLALLIVLVSQINWLIAFLTLHPFPPFPALQDYIYFGFYPCLILAILSLPTRQISGLARVRILLDSLIVIVALATLCYYFWLAPILVNGEGTLAAKLVSGAYPLLDLVLAFCLLLVIFRSSESGLRPILIMLSIAVILLFIGHIFHLQELLFHTQGQNSWVNGGWLYAMVLMVGSAQTMSRRLQETVEFPMPAELLENTQEDPLAVLSQTRWKNLAPSVLVLIFGLIILGIWLLGRNWLYPGHQNVVYVGGFLVLILMVLRQLLAMYEISQLQSKLQDTNHRLQALNMTLEEQATSDALTGLLNHGALAELLQTMPAKQTLFSLIFIDIDQFKAINDHYGHAPGDRVLLQFAGIVRVTLRRDDTVGRWGGEEFVALLPATGAIEAYKIAERIRNAVVRQIFPVGPAASPRDSRLYTLPKENLSAPRLTCSLGVATFPQDAISVEGLIKAADIAMYTAKRLGRNQTCAYSDLDVPKYRSQETL